LQKYIPEPYLLSSLQKYIPEPCLLTSLQKYIPRCLTHVNTVLIDRFHTAAVVIARSGRKSWFSYVFVARSCRSSTDLRFKPLFRLNDI
jgi:hypothetical protein